MAEAFGRPEDFFAASNARMAGQRLLGINAIRANPSVVGYSLTGTVDQGMTAEGQWTTFRELKPGTADAVFDGFAPLRWCLFTEPVNVYRKTPVRLDAVLANEDVLAPGEYPVKFEVFGPHANRVFEKTVTVKIAARTADSEPPMVMPVFAEDVTIDAPAGKYRFTATFLRGAAAAGESIEFYLDDPATMPAVTGEVTLWGEGRRSRQVAGRQGYPHPPVRRLCPDGQRSHPGLCQGPRPRRRGRIPRTHPADRSRRDRCLPLPRGLLRRQEQHRLPPRWPTRAPSPACPHGCTTRRNGASGIRSSTACPPPASWTTPSIAR